MSGTQTVQMQQPQQDSMATSIEHLSKPEPQNKMVNNIVESYQDMEIMENEDDNPEEIYNRRMMNDVNEPINHQQLDNEVDEQHLVNDNNNNNINVPQKSMVNSLIASLKGPLIVMVIFFVLSQGFVINTINSILINYLGNESNYNMYGLILRSVISAILFYAVNFFS